MTAPIKGCPQLDPPELVMRADGYHYRTEDEMQELKEEQIDDLIRTIATYDLAGWKLWGRSQIYRFVNAVIAADRALNAADRGVTRQEPAGWKLVPIEPTQSMVDGAFNEYRDWRMHSDGEPGNRDGYKRLYKAMLAAAPTPPAEQQEEQEPAAYMRHRLMSNAGGFGGGVVCEFSEQPFNDDGGSDGIEALYVHQSPSLAELRAKVEALPRGVNQLGAMYIILDDVLAEIDKLGGGV